ncbi:hypothetical protein EBB79_13750 [Parasedimentitalea marina]|uniref:DUF4178 domain-containing protein n=1 Tax=Parasedimentitalea marina TaxID=2483033 RepID=A0A3T0N8W2_9RHOB|nr:hypothetical protein [Parasedimentitalea marina]AZV80468.1 hypothetical protein EBB79_13750 [Parasedimentitalea marina]
MGLFDWLSGTKKPETGTEPAPAEDVQAAILAVNRDTAPYSVRTCSDGSCDFMAEWQIVDAKWVEVFAKAGLERAARIKMRLDVDKREVRAVDEDYTISWRVGVPQLSFSASAFRGQKKEVSFGRAYGFTEELRPGEIYNYRFDSKEMKAPLQDVVTGKGWVWRGVAFGKL